MAKEKDGDIPSHFFELYGNEIIDKKALSEPGVVLNLLIPIIKNKNDKGIEWLAIVIEKLPGILANKKRDDIKEFRERVAELLPKSEGSIQKNIEKIAHILKIERKDNNQSDKMP